MQKQNWGKRRLEKLVIREADKTELKKDWKLAVFMAPSYVEYYSEPQFVIIKTKEWERNSADPRPSLACLPSTVCSQLWKSKYKTYYVKKETPHI